MRRSSGLSLIETIVAMSILAFVMGAVFLAFTQSSRTFRHALLRQGLQGDAVKMESLLGRDIRVTDYHSNITTSRSFTTSDGRVVRRDGLSVAALSDWDDPTKFDSVTGLPLWDQYIVYYATDGEDEGRLIRQVVDGGGPTNGFPYFGLSGNMATDPLINSNALSTTLISSQVDHFEVASDDGTQGLDIILRLRRRGERRRSGGEEKVDETLETRYSPVARNTFPKL
jgi:type II secretory pathway pseudopilin PulG